MLTLKEPNTYVTHDGTYTIPDQDLPAAHAVYQRMAPRAFDHWWVCYGGFIIDPTTKQFGSVALTITEVGDNRYDFE